MSLAAFDHLCTTSIGSVPTYVEAKQTTLLSNHLQATTLFSKSILASKLPLPLDANDLSDSKGQLPIRFGLTVPVAKMPFAFRVHSSACEVNQLSMYTL